MAAFGKKTSFPSAFLICVYQRFKVRISPLILFISTTSPIRKGRLNTSKIPARRFSPISFKANPIIKAEIPASVKSPTTTPIRPMVLKIKSKPSKITRAFKIVAKKFARRGSCILFDNLLQRKLLDLRTGNIKIIRIATDNPARIKP
jgi:hypothetical protein